MFTRMIICIGGVVSQRTSAFRVLMGEQAQFDMQLKNKIKGLGKTYAYS